MVNQVDAARFRASGLPAGRVPVLFTADWCGFSRRFYPQFRQRLPEGWVVDASDEDDPVWDIYRLEVVPTVILFQDGEPVQRWEGVLGERHAEDIQAQARAEPA